MSESFNKVQLSEFFSQTGQMVVRTDDVEEAIDAWEALAKGGERIVDASLTIRNIAKTKGTLQDAYETKGAGAVKASGAKSSAPARKGGNVCEHGLPWNDLQGETNKAGELYKNRYYCAYETKNWKERCKPWGENEA